MNCKPIPRMNPDDLTGTAALLEVAAMGRVAGLGMGRSLADARAAQLHLEAARARRRGDGERAAALVVQAEAQRALSQRIVVERERETQRAAVAGPEETLIQGRVTDQGIGRKGVRVDLATPEGQSFAHATTADAGAFTLRGMKAVPANARLVASDGKGRVFKTDCAPTLQPGQRGYVEIAIDGSKPKEPGRPPDEGEVRDLVKVPQLIGRHVDDAQGLLKEVKLVARVEEVPTTRAEPGIVLKQHPEAGSLTEPGSEVLLAIATQPGRKMVDLGGLTLKELPERLKREGLVLGSVDLAANPRQAGRVIGQSPTAGLSVGPETRVVVRVATGVAEADMETAMILGMADPRIAELGLGEQRLREGMKRADVRDIKSLRTLSARSAAQIGQVFGIADRAQSAQLRTALGELAARFPQD